MVLMARRAPTTVKRLPVMRASPSQAPKFVEANITR